MIQPNQFEVFWLSYPLKVKKLAARKAWLKAAAVAEFDKIMAGLEAYKKFKPATQDWCHAATWLNGERWDDEWKSAPKPVAKQNIPTRDLVYEYAKQKGDTTGFAIGFYSRWAGRNFQSNGVNIDWKIQFSEEFAKQRQ
jgi:hypothetical protein